MSERIYRLDGDGEPQPLAETPFPREADIQRLIAAHPEVLAGEAMTPAAPRRWLLVGDEVPVPDGAGGARWALDILLIDQDARPTLVEVKRGSNPEVRREVLGQMLDYVAHAERYRPVSMLRSAARRRTTGARAASRTRSRPCSTRTSRTRTNSGTTSTPTCARPSCACSSSPTASPTSWRAWSSS